MISRHSFFSQKEYEKALQSDLDYTNLFEEVVTLLKKSYQLEVSLSLEPLFYPLKPRPEDLGFRLMLMISKWRVLHGLKPEEPIEDWYRVLKDIKKYITDSDEVIKAGRKLLKKDN